MLKKEKGPKQSCCENQAKPYDSIGNRLARLVQLQLNRSSVKQPKTGLNWFESFEVAD